MDTLIRDRIVIGLRDGAIIERLLVEKDLTLECAIDLCRAEESAKRYCVEITSGGAAAAVNKISTYKHAKKFGAKPRGQPRLYDKSQQSKQKQCPRCTENHDHGNCPARNSHHGVKVTNQQPKSHHKQSIWEILLQL